jgi:hypothetical protein
VVDSSGCRLHYIAFHFGFCGGVGTTKIKNAVGLDIKKVPTYQPSENFFKKIFFVYLRLWKK